MTKEKQKKLCDNNNVERKKKINNDHKNTSNMLMLKHFHTPLNFKFYFWTHSIKYSNENTSKLNEKGERMKKKENNLKKKIKQQVENEKELEMK